MVSRFIRAFVLTTGIYSMILWLYIVARIIIDQIDAFSPFINTFPYISVLELAILSFIVSFACTFIYLSFWGRFRMLG